MKVVVFKHIKKFIRIFCVLCVICGAFSINAETTHATSLSVTSGSNSDSGTSTSSSTTSTDSTSDLLDSSDNEKVSGDGSGLTLNINGEGTTLSGTLQILIGLTILSIAPAILIMVTSFTRIIIVLHFARTALATQTAPPNQVLIGLAIFLTIFIMGPTATEIYNNAVVPYEAGTLTQEEAIDEGIKPLRTFMLKQTQEKDIKLFMDIQGLDSVESEDDIPITILIPSFILSELRTAFIIGFLLYIPFIVIDMVVASVLMSMGMMMLPPTTISMPFKILLFILADGWNLLIGNLVKTFY